MQLFHFILAYFRNSKPSIGFNLKDDKNHISLLILQVLVGEEGFFSPFSTSAP